MQLKTKNKGTIGLAMVALLMACMSTTASANVMGFDFGSTFFKITLVQPGKPFQIVENTTSKRKTDSQFTITKEQRLFGADSFIGTTRFFKTTFADVASMFATPFSQETVKSLKLDKFILNDFVEDERGLLAVQTFSIDKKELKDDENAKTTYLSEELAAQILAYGRELAEKQAGGQIVKDAVITVPSYYNAERRRMLLDAAELAGINVTQLVHENTAAALMYGVDRMDTEKDLNVLIYNMGGRDTEVSLVRYSAVTDAKNKTYEYVEVIGEGYDETLGGKAFNDILVSILADKFNSLKERQGKPDIRENDRAMKRLYKEAIGIKDILSANKVVNVKVPELADYVTLAFELTRETFEDACAALFERVKGPIEKALKQAELTAADIDQVEIIGGAIRVPKVQAILKQAVNDQELHVHLNGDEAMSFGSAFIAANSTSSFKVRKVYLTQHPKYDVRIKITPSSEQAIAEKQDKAAEQGEESAEEPIVYEKDTMLYKRSDYLGQKKTIHLFYDVSMKIEATAIYPCGYEENIANWELDVTKLIEEKEVLRKERVTRPKLSLSFELSRSHLFQLLSAKVNVEETVLEEVVKEKQEEEKKDEEDKKDDNADSEASEGTNEEKDTEKIEEAPESKVEDEQSESDPEQAQEPQKEYVEKVVPHTFEIKDLNEELPGLRLMSKDMKKAGKSKLKSLNQRDKDKMMADEAKNAYESMIYSLRDWLTDEDNAAYVPEADREALLQKLEDGEEWLYDEGSQVSHSKYQERSYELTKEQTKFQKRKQEHKNRENSIPKLRDALEESRSRAHEIREKMPWVTEQEQTDLVAKIEETRDWLDGKLQEQEKLSLTEEPAFTIEDVDKEMAKMNKLAKKIFGKKKPKEQKKPKEEEKKEEEKSEETKEEKSKQEEPKQEESKQEEHVEDL